MWFVYLFGIYFSYILLKAGSKTAETEGWLGWFLAIFIIVIIWLTIFNIRNRVGLMTVKMEMGLKPINDEKDIAEEKEYGIIDFSEKK